MLNDSRTHMHIRCSDTKWVIQYHEFVDPSKCHEHNAPTNLHELTLIERNPPSQGGFLFTMFSNQEPCVKDFTTRYDGRISSWNLVHTALDQGSTQQRNPPGGGVPAINLQIRYWKSDAIPRTWWSIYMSRTQCVNQPSRTHSHIRYWRRDQIPRTWWSIYMSRTQRIWMRHLCIFVFVCAM